MNYKFLGAALVGLVLGFFLFSSHGANLGAVTITPSNALDQQVLTNELQNLANPLGSIVQSSTAALTFPAVVSSTAYQTSTQLAIAAAQGDFVMVSPSTSTPGIVYYGYVVTASTSNATFGISVQNASATNSITPAVTSFNFTVLPFASFKAPTGL